MTYHLVLKFTVRSALFYNYVSSQQCDKDNTVNGCDCDHLATSSLGTFSLRGREPLLGPLCELGTGGEEGAMQWGPHKRKEPKGFFQLRKKTKIKIVGPMKMCCILHTCFSLVQIFSFIGGSVFNRVFFIIQC